MSEPIKEGELHKKKAKGMEGREAHFHPLLAPCETSPQKNKINKMGEKMTKKNSISDTSDSGVNGRKPVQEGTIVCIGNLDNNQIVVFPKINPYI